MSGTAATAPDGSALHPGDTYGQTREAFERAVAAAQALGANVGDTVRTRLFLGPDSDWREAVRAHRELFEGIDPRTRRSTSPGSSRPAFSSRWDSTPG